MAEAVSESYDPIARIPPINTTETTTVHPPSSDDIVSPPPAYSPGPNPSQFIRPLGHTNSWDQASQAAWAPQTPEQQALVQYFTDLFTRWIGYGVLFWKYGLPYIKWGWFFYGRQKSGLTQFLMLSTWLTIWAGPGIYFSVLNLELEEVKKGGTQFRDTMSTWVGSVVFWAILGGINAIKWGTLYWASGFSPLGWRWFGSLLVWAVTFGRV